MLSTLMFLQSFISIQRLRRDDRGSAGVEYSLILLLIVMAIVGAVSLVGQNLEPMFARAASAL